MLHKHIYIVWVGALPKQTKDNQKRCYSKDAIQKSSTKLEIYHLLLTDCAQTHVQQSYSKTRFCCGNKLNSITIKHTQGKRSALPKLI